MSLSTDPGAPADAGAPDTGDRPDSHGRQRFGTAWLAAALVVGALLGLGAGLLAPTVNRPGNDSAEAGFIRDMSTHHAQAVEMSMITHAKATDPDVRTLAADIALTQHGQINIMQTWLRTWSLGPTGSQRPMAWMSQPVQLRNGLMPGMATPEQLAALRSGTGTVVDVQFLELMRNHHLGGIHMAHEIIRLSDNEQVTELAGTMVSGQQGEINLINELLRRLQTTS